MNDGIRRPAPPVISSLELYYRDMLTDARVEHLEQTSVELRPLTPEDHETIKGLCARFRWRQLRDEDGDDYDEN